MSWKYFVWQERSKRTRILGLSSLLIVAAAVTFAVGGFLARHSYFPFGRGFGVYLGIVDPVGKATPASSAGQPPSFAYSSDSKCNSLSYDRQTLLNVRESLQTAPRGMKYLFGDSVIADARDLRVFGLDYVGIGVSGQVIYCALADIDILLSAKPSEVVLYLGGNDADGQSWYGAAVAGEHYEKLVRRLLDEGATVVVHAIHLGYHRRRNVEYALELNRVLKAMSERLKLRYIEPTGALRFGSTDGVPYGSGDIYNESTFDGEHLKGNVYAKWFARLRERLQDTSDAAVTLE